jgi:glycerol-3-phosphate dehydrogenase
MSNSKMEHILIIGGGVGGALAHDLVLRGFRVTLVEKGELLSGTTGRHHGLLHSGGRYVLNDPETARECFAENQILRRIAPQAIEPNGGLFIALNDEDLSYQDQFVESCRSVGIPVTAITAREALAREPALNPDLKSAVCVPDATMDAWRLAMPFFATAKANGAVIRPFCEVISLVMTGRQVGGVRIRDHRHERTELIGADLVVNSGGPWVGRIAAMAGLEVPIQPGPGVMVAIRGRMTQAVINRLHPAGEGDIIVPQRRLSILGTTGWLADDPDRVTVPAEHVTRLQSLCSRLVPAVGSAARHAAWSASRPLLRSGETRNPFAISRTFDCFDHARRDAVEGLVTLIGGKATTMRAMAEQTADLICRKTGRTVACRTRETVLLPYRRYWLGAR